MKIKIKYKINNKGLFLYVNEDVLGFRADVAIGDRYNIQIFNKPNLRKFNDVIVADEYEMIVDDVRYLTKGYNETEDKQEYSMSDICKLSSNIKVLEERSNT